LLFNRRDFLLGTAAAAAQAGVAAALPPSAETNQGHKADTGAPRSKPNIVIYHSDHSVRVEKIRSGLKRLQKNSQGRDFFCMAMNCNIKQGNEK
jgi:hypothetical protein